MDVSVTYNSSTKRRGQYIAYAATRAADGPDGMEARGRPFSAGGKGLKVDSRRTFPASPPETRAHIGPLSGSHNATPVTVRETCLVCS